MQGMSKSYSGFCRWVWVVSIKWCAVHPDRDLPGIAVYFVAIIGLAGDFALKLKLPFLTWMVLFGLTMLCRDPWQR